MKKILIKCLLIFLLIHLCMYIIAEDKSIEISENENEEIFDITNTAWRGLYVYNDFFDLYFLENGLLEYRSQTSYRKDGVWKQDGNQVYFEIHNGYHQGYGSLISRNKMIGYTIPYYGRGRKEPWDWNLKCYNQQLKEKKVSEWSQSPAFFYLSIAELEFKSNLSENLILVDLGSLNVGGGDGNSLIGLTLLGCDYNFNTKMYEIEPIKINTKICIFMLERSKPAFEITDYLYCDISLVNAFISNVELFPCYLTIGNKFYLRGNSNIRAYGIDLSYRINLKEVNNNNFMLGFFLLFGGFASGS